MTFSERATDLQDEGDDSLLVAIAIERIGALALATRTDEAIATAEVALRTATGSDRTALTVAAARRLRSGPAIRPMPNGISQQVDEPDDPQVNALAAHIALNAADLNQALTLATRAAAVAEETGSADVACAALGGRRPSVAAPGSSNFDRRLRAGRADRGAP